MATHALATRTDRRAERFQRRYLAAWLRKDPGAPTVMVGDLAWVRWAIACHDLEREIRKALEPPILWLLSLPLRLRRRWWTVRP